jgi:phosphate uptake regulator
MENKRKVQFIAGTTYSLSLPKQWILKNNIKAGDMLVVNEASNRSLNISLEHIHQDEELTIDVSNLTKDLDQIIYSIYYIGIENINLTHKKEFSRETRLKIRKTVSELSGTEIIHEQKNLINIKVLLDKSKIDVYQIFYRIHLIIDSELEELSEEGDVETITFYEREVDRLYHLCTKILKTALINTNVLNSSKIENVQLVPGFFLLSKRLENISDNIEYIAKRIMKKELKSIEMKPTITILRKELQRSAKQLIQINKKSEFSTTTKQLKKEIEKSINTIQDEHIRIRLWEIEQFIINVQEEIVGLTFYKHQFKKK